MSEILQHTIVLAIDDEPAIGPLLERALAKWCGEYHFATSRSEAEEILATNEVTHVVADYDMGRGELTGAELIVDWKARFPSIIRAIILSGKDLEGVAIPEEVDEVLGKPCEREVLREALGIV